MRSVFSSAVLCHVCFVVFVGCFLLQENTYVVKKQVKMKSDIAFFARKRYAVTVNRISVSPSSFCWALNS